MKKSIKREKSYAQKITQAKRLELLKKVNEAINHHESMKYSYFWEGGNRSQRKWKEKQNNFSIIFNYGGVEYEYRSRMSCSSRHVYSTRSFFVGEDRKTVRAFKKVQEELKTAIENYNAKNIKNKEVEEDSVTNE